MNLLTILKKLSKWRSCWQPKSIYDTIEPFHWILYTHGMAAFTYNRATRKFTITWKSVMWNSIVHIALLYNSFIITRGYLKGDIKNTEKTAQKSLVATGWKILTVVLMCITVCLVVTNAFGRKQMKEFVDTLHEFDVETNSMTYQVNHRHQGYSILFYVLLKFTALCSLTFVHLMHKIFVMNDYNAYKLIIHTVYYAITQLILVQLIFVFASIRSRIKVMNRNLKLLRKKKMVLKSATKIISVKTSPIDNQLWLMSELKKFTKLHIKLMKAINICNSYFTLMIVPLIAYILVANIFHLCSLVRHLRIQDWNGYFILIMDPIWDLYCSLYLLLVVYTAHITVSCSCDTSTIAHEIANELEDVVILKKFETFCQQLKPVVFTCHLFDIDWPLIFNVSFIAYRNNLLTNHFL